MSSIRSMIEFSSTDWHGTQKHPGGGTMGPICCPRFASRGTTNAKRQLRLTNVLSMAFFMSKTILRSRDVNG